jgi:hypothetical protein
VVVLVDFCRITTAKVRLALIRFSLFCFSPRAAAAQLQKYSGHHWGELRLELALALALKLISHLINRDHK